MKSIKWIGVFALALFANNLGLLYLLGYFSSTDDKSVDRQLTQESNLPTGQLEQAHQAENLAINQSPTDTDLSQGQKTAIQQYLSGPEYEALLMSSLEQVFQNLSNQTQSLSNKSGMELLDLYRESSTRMEKRQVLGLLRNMRDSDLETYELKNIFFGLDLMRDDDADLIKIDFLTKLVEHGDPEGLEWAKEWLRAGNMVTGINRGTANFYKDLYNQDSAFFKSWVGGLSFDDMAQSYWIGQTISGDSELVDGFFNTHLDTILSSNNSEWHEYADRVFGHRPDWAYEFEAYQEEQITALFSSSNTISREFAISLSQNIKNPQLLVSGYESLKGTSEQRDFIRTLWMRGGPYRGLASELSERSSDPELKRYISR